MTEKEAIYILRNAAWLGSDADRQKVEEAVEVVANAIEAQDMILYMNLPEVSVEEAIEILKRNSRFELILSDKDINVPSTDTISRQDAISGVRELYSMGDCYCDEYSVVWMLNSLPSAQPDVPDTNVGDMISRQAAINAINTWDKFGVDERSRVVRWHEGLEPYVHLRDVVAAIGNLPPAQPEIIRCKYCKHSEHWYWDKRRCFLWHETGIDVFEDGYCNYAKRRADADMRGKQDDYEKKDIPLNTDDIFDAELAKRIMNNK